MKSAIGILCGGKSRRMGRDKASLKWNDETMLERVIREMSSDGRELLISAAAEQTSKVKAQVEDLDIFVVSDEYFDHGPLEGIRCVMKQAQSDYIFFCAVDMPFITLETVDYLEQRMEDPENAGCDCIVMEEGDRTHPLCGIYHKRALSVLEQQLEEGNYRAMAFLRKLNWKTVQVEVSGLDSRVLWNANTPEDYERALAQLR